MIFRPPLPAMIFGYDVLSASCTRLGQELSIGVLGDILLGFLAEIAFAEWHTAQGSIVSNMKLSLYFYPFRPSPSNDFDSEPIEFEDHVGAVVPVVGDLYWPPKHYDRPVRVVERGFSYSANQGIRVSLRCEWVE